VIANFSTSGESGFGNGSSSKSTSSAIFKIIANPYGKVLGTIPQGYLS